MCPTMRHSPVVAGASMNHFLLPCCLVSVCLRSALCHVYTFVGNLLESETTLLAPLQRLKHRNSDLLKSCAVFVFIIIRSFVRYSFLQGFSPLGALRPTPLLLLDEVVKVRRCQCMYLRRVPCIRALSSLRFPARALQSLKIFESSRFHFPAVEYRALIGWRHPETPSERRFARA